MTGQGLRRAFTTAKAKFDTLPPPMRKRVCAGLFCYAAGPTGYAMGALAAWKINGWLGAIIALTGATISYGIGDGLLGDSALRIFFPRHYKGLPHLLSVSALSAALVGIPVAPRSYPLNAQSPPGLIRYGHPMLPSLREVHP